MKTRKRNGIFGIVLVVVLITGSGYGQPSDEPTYYPSIVEFLTAPPPDFPPVENVVIDYFETTEQGLQQLYNDYGLVFPDPDIYMEYSHPGFDKPVIYRNPGAYLPLTIQFAVPVYVFGMLMNDFGDWCFDTPAMMDITFVDDTSVSHTFPDPDPTNIEIHARRFFGVSSCKAIKEIIFYNTCSLNDGFWLRDSWLSFAPLNSPPVAICQNVIVPVGQIPNINNGSYDPDGDPITLSQSPSGAFSEAGIYGVTLTVTDSYEASDSCNAMVVVYDPSGGFVTGGGWIDSPAGAYKSDPSLEGTAHFGFVSKYKKGATVPTGQTEFIFQTACLNFHSSSYDWLIVNQAGSNAQFKGSGTINHETDCKFMLWARDGAPDTFRIKIWWEEGEIEHVVYDNGFDQEIDGGSIVIHTQ